MPVTTTLACGFVTAMFQSREDLMAQQLSANGRQTATYVCNMTASGVRDIRPSAHEIKFVVSSGLGHLIRETARLVLSPDPHATGPMSDEYRTTTLYFDTEEFAVFRRNGSYRRAKYRIRRYGQSNVVFLERKLRTRSVLSKRRSPMPVTDLGRLANGALESTWPGGWFSDRLRLRRLSPVCQLSYSRTARVGRNEHGAFRLTLDEDLSAQVVETTAFRDADGVELLAGQTILEMKFVNTMPAVFKRIIEDFRLEPTQVSKYRLGIQSTRMALSCAN